MKKWYITGQITITNADNYMAYASSTKKIVKKLGRKYLVWGGEQDVKECNPSSNRNVVVKFENIQRANAFHNSEECAKIMDILEDNSEGYFVIIEGY